MSFNLPRNSRDLRFTGELRAELGRARRTPRDVYQAEPIATPYMAGPPAASIEILEEIFEDDDDDAPTTMLDRDGLDVIAGGLNGPRPKPQPRQHATAPIPNFRRVPETPSVIIAPEPLPAPPPARQGPPLGFWLVAAMLAAVISYKVAPMAVSQADSVVHLLEPHTAAPSE